MQSRENYYLLLKLDPAVDDWPTIEKAIDDGRRKWSAAMNGPAALQRKAEVALRQVPAMIQLLKDPGARKLEALEARRLAQEERKQKFAKLDQAIDAVRVSGTCTKEQVAHIVKALGGVFTEAEVIDRLEAAGLTIAGDAGKPRQERAKPRLDPSKMKDINDQLALLDLKSLYQLLELNHRSSAKALSEAADRRNRELKRTGLTDPKSTARGQLYGKCMDVFSSETEKEKYDNSFGFLVMEELRPNLEIVASNGVVTLEGQEFIVKRARERGVEAEDARAFISEVATARRWKVQQAPPTTPRLPAEDLPLCGFCGALAESAAAKRCKGCGESLTIHCPRCAGEMPTSARACSRCGCKLGDAATVKALLHEGQTRAADGDYVAALAALDRALTYWNGWEPAQTARREILARHGAREKAIGEVEALIAARRLIAARWTLERVRREHGPGGLEPLDRSIAERVARAEADYRAGEQARAARNIEAAIERYEAALAACADLEAARQALSTCPPEAPRALTVTALPSGFRLAWPAVAGRGVGYVAIRWADGHPASRTDGTIVGRVQSPTVDDVQLTPGTPYYYAVYAQRGEISSREPAISGPHLRTAEVEALEGTSGDAQVSLTWRRPAGAARVVVRRAEGAPPASATAGVEITASEGCAHDTGLQNGARYGYRVCVVYLDPERPNAEIVTPGLCVEAQPAAPPPPVRDLKATRAGTAVTLTWSPLPGVGVEIRRSTAPPGWAEGSIVSLAAVDRLGPAIPVTSPGRGEATADTADTSFFIPVTVARGVAVVGTHVALTLIDDVQDLRSQCVGRDIVLTWTWPRGADEVVVCHAADGYPEHPQDPRAERIPVNRAAYDRASGFDLRNQDPARHYFTVFTRSRGGEAWSQGARVLETMGQTSTVQYRVAVTRTGLLKSSIGSVRLELAGSEDMVVPPVVLVGKAGTLPLTASDGEQLAELAEIVLASGRASFEVPRRYWGSSLLVKLFFKEGRYAQDLRLLPASPSDLRLR